MNPFRRLVAISVASVALAADPELSKSEERAVEVARQFVELMHSDQEAATRLATDASRNRILKEPWGSPKSIRLYLIMPRETSMVIGFEDDRKYTRLVLVPAGGSWKVDLEGSYAEMEASERVDGFVPQTDMLVTAVARKFAEAVVRDKAAAEPWITAGSKDLLETFPAPRTDGSVFVRFIRVDGNRATVDLRYRNGAELHLILVKQGEEWVVDLVATRETQKIQSGR